MKISGGMPYETVFTTVRVGKKAKKRIALFRFDANGEADVDYDDKMIARLKVHYNVENEPNYKCKYCDFETDNKGVLMAHYKEHKRSEK